LAGLRRASEPRAAVLPSVGSGHRTLWLGSVTGFFLLALIAGGTPRYGPPFNTILELLSLPIVLVAAFLILDQPLTRPVKGALLICAGIFLLPLLQLVPLPPAVWTALPGRGFVVDVFEAARLPLIWMPLSLSPPATLRSLLSLFPCFAVFLATLTLRPSERRIMVLVLIGFGIASVPFGLAQIAGGPASRLRLYEITNISSAVGFFANRNHYAALLYAVMPFIAAWMISRLRSTGRDRLGWVALLVVIYGILILGLGLAASRAGLVLAMAAILASVLLAWRGRRVDGRKNLASRVVLAAGFLGSCVMLQFGLIGILGRLEHDPLDDGRLTIAQVTLRAAASVFPFGSGIGSFVPLYAMFEAPANMGANYVNHAHNDWLELWLEAGVPGLVLALLFLGWFAATAYRAWRRHDSSLDGLLVQAASISAMLLLAHSLVDYPLRTTAMACVFAFACAMVASATGKSRETISKDITLSNSRDGEKHSRAYPHLVAKSPQFGLNEGRRDLVGFTEESALNPFSRATSFSHRRRRAVEGLRNE